MSTSSSSNSSASSSSGSESEPSTSRSQLKRKRPAKAGRSLAQGSASDSKHDEEAPDEDSDVPVLSHAEKRRQKKKQKLESDEKVEVATKTAKDKSSQKTIDKSKSKSKTDNAAALPERQNSVWVGNLSYRTTPQSIREFFKDVGEITRVHMPTKAATAPGGTKENRGFAYVDFASPDAKVIAITLSESELEGRRLLIKDGDDFTGRPAPVLRPNAENSKDAGAASTSNSHSRTAQKILASQKQPPGPTLFLGNLSFESTEQSIREMLEAHRAPEKKGADNAGEKEKEGWMRKIRLFV